MEWVSTITAAVEEELQPLESLLDLRVEHMDTKRFNTPEYLDTFKELLAHKYDGFAFDLVLVSDNNAFEFIRRHRDEMFPGTPVVFCGVNGFDPSSLNGLTGFTGVAEVYAARATVELMLELHPNAREIFILNDYLTTGRQVHRALRSGLAGLERRVTIHHSTNLPLDELLSDLSQLEPHQLVLLGVYYTDATGRHSTFRRMGEIIAEASAVPVYCLLDFNLGTGTVGGRVTGARVQGEAAASLARRVLDGEDVRSVTPLADGAFRWVFDHSALERWALKPEQLPAGSEIIGRPSSFFGEHRDLVLGTLAVLGILVVIIAVLSVNIRQRQSAERALRESEDDLATTLQSIGDGVIATDLTGVIVRLNPVAENLLGWSLGDARGKHLSEVFKLRPSPTAPPGSSADLSFRTVLESGETVTIARGTILETRSGQELLVADSGAPIRSGDGRTRGVVIVFRDVTEQMRVEQQLQQAQEMESVGQLAGGIAHDFNNMLTGIMGYAEMLETELRDRPDLADSATRVLKAAERASDLTRKLLDFSRKGKLLSTLIDLREVVTDSVSLLERTLGQGVTLEVDLSDEPISIVGDPTQLQQVVMNLCINARDAMPEGGVIRLTTEHVDLDAAHCERSSFELQPGPHARLTVTDNGTGIAPEVCDRIFEPFFTTKGRGHGTGLGLAASYGAIKDHGGAITVASHVGLGSTFTIDLPRQGSPPVVAVADIPIEADDTPLGHILLVDDDETVRIMTRDMLTSAGYLVTTAVDGVECIEVYSSRPAEFDLVLLDLVMPRLGGRHAFHGLRRLDPQVRVILASGFAEKSAVADLLSDGLCGFLNKPFRRGQLLDMVAAAGLQTRTQRDS